VIELSEEQRQELEKPDPVRVRDPKTNEVYVLVRAEIYERMRPVLDGFARRAGWDDPEMDVYDELYGDKI
jgi:hypothetical protein